MPKVTEAHLEARRQQILDAAWSCFARKGYHQTTMQDICQESELSPGAVYRYFESKEAILKGINDRSQEMGRRLVEAARSLAEGPLDTLEVIGETIFSAFDDPMFETMTRVNIEIWPELIRNDVLRESLRQELTFWRKVVVELLSEAKAVGQVKPEVEPEPLAVLLMCAWEGLRHYNLIDPESFKPQQVIELMRSLASERWGEAPKPVRSLGQGLPFGTRVTQRRRATGKKQAKGEKEGKGVRVRS